MHLLLHPGDDRPRFAEISLRVPWRMRQRYEHLPAMAAMLTNVVLHDRVPTGESLFVTKTLEDALRRVPLLPIAVAAIVLKPPVKSVPRTKLPGGTEPMRQEPGADAGRIDGGRHRLGAMIVSPPSVWRSLGNYPVEIMGP